MSKLDWLFAHSEGLCDVIYVEEQYVDTPLLYPPQILSSPACSVDELNFANLDLSSSCLLLCLADSSVLSSGSDGQVRRYDTSPAALEQMDDPTLLYDHDRATCIAVSREVRSCKKRP